MMVSAEEMEEVGRGEGAGEEEEEEEGVRERRASDPKRKGSSASEAEEEGASAREGATSERKRKGSSASEGPGDVAGEVVTKKPKKKPNVWTKTTSRKGSKKSGNRATGPRNGEKREDTIEVNPSQRFLFEDKNGIQLSKDQKAEKVELSADKLTASSEKGYRMVRATRGVADGAWYFEITVKDLGKTGHTRLGWCTWKGDLQAPVGFDSNSYAYRDMDGSKVHQARRESYGEAYVEGDVIGFYINLPNGAALAPKYDLYLSRTTKMVFPVPVDKSEGPPKPVPGSEIMFFKNGVCQGVAYTDIYAGEYYPAASMYTLPSPEKKCSVRFNFGPVFQYPPEDLGDRPTPRPMAHAPTPAGLAPSECEEKPPVNGSKDPKKGDNVSGTATKTGGKQRMAAERGNGEGEVAGARTKRAAGDKDKGKRTGPPGKKGPTGKGPRKGILFTSNLEGVRSPVSESELQIEVNLEGCGNESSGDPEAGPAASHEPAQSSEEPLDD